MQIRRAVPADLQTIVGLIESLADYEKLRDQCRVTAERLKPHLFSEHPLIHCLIAEVPAKENQLPVAAGFALYFFNFSTFLAKPGLYLEDLFVRPEFRGAGIGLALFKRLAGEAKERGCGRMEWSVLNWNDPAISFYKRLGAGPMDDWTVYRLTADKFDKFGA